MSLISTDELKALRDADALHTLSHKILVATIKDLVEDCIEYREVIERIGFRILEGDFTLRDGTISRIYLEKIGNSG